MSKLIRFIESVIVLSVICLSWYGAEMLLYSYSQPSIVDAFVAVCIALSITGKMEKERIANEYKREFIKGLAEGIQKGNEEGKDGNPEGTAEAHGPLGNR